MGVPVPAAQFVAQQSVARGGIRDAEQSFGQTHERLAFRRGQRVGTEHGTQRAGRAGAQGFHQGTGNLLRLRRQGGGGQQSGNAIGLGQTASGRNGTAQGPLLNDLE